MSSQSLQVEKRDINHREEVSTLGLIAQSSQPAKQHPRKKQKLSPATSEPPSGRIETVHLNEQGSIPTRLHTGAEDRATTTDQEISDSLSIACPPGLDNQSSYTARHLSSTLSSGAACTMSDGSTSKRSSKTTNLANRGSENEARALRVLEVMNDFRTLQTHITSLVTRADASPPDQSAYYLGGYTVLRQCNAEAQAILATHYNPGNLGIEPGRVADTEVHKATLQR